MSIYYQEREETTMKFADEIAQNHYLESREVEGGVDEYGNTWAACESRCKCGRWIGSHEDHAHHVAIVTAELLASILDRTAATVAEQHGAEPRGMFEISIDRAVVSGIEIATRAIRAMVVDE